MKRRNFVASVLAGGVAGTTLLAQRGRDQDEDHDSDHDHDHDHEEMSGPEASVTVGFGQWKTVPSLDRFMDPAPITGNNHMVLPFETEVKAGGAINFAISGFHILTIYGPGTKFEDVNGTLLADLPGAPMGFPKIVDDPLNRIYRGNNPLLVPQDRTESVTLSKRGRYLVVCTFVPHFNDRMHGYVRVVK